MLNLKRFYMSKSIEPKVFSLQTFSTQVHIMQHMPLRRESQILLQLSAAGPTNRSQPKVIKQ